MIRNIVTDRIVVSDYPRRTVAFFEERQHVADAVRAIGTLVLSVRGNRNEPATLYIDGAPWGQVGSGSTTRIRLPEASYRLSWDGGRVVDNEIVQITAQQTTSVTLQSYDLETGGFLTGHLTNSGPQVGSRHVTYYEMWVDAGRQDIFDLTSDDFDTFLFVELPGQSRRSDDDGGNGSDSRETVRAGRDGVARIGASSYRGRSTGTFRLSVR